MTLDGIKAVICGIDGVRAESEPAEAFSGAAEWVQRCRAAGLKLGVASSASLTEVEATLEKIGLPSREWDAIVSAEDVTARQPAPDLFLAAARKLALPAAQCVVIDDTVPGVQAAKAAGMRSIALTRAFPVDAMPEADSFRPRIADVTERDLTGSSATDASSATSAGHEPPPIPAPAALPPPLPAKRARQAVHVKWAILWRTVWQGVVIAAAFVFAQGLVALVFELMARSQGRTLDPENGLFMAIAILFAAPVMAWLSWLMALRSSTDPRDVLALKPAPGATVFGWCFLLVLLIGFMDGLTVLLDRPVVPDVMVRAYQTAGFMPLFLLAILVFAPVGEEVFFRGFLITGLRDAKLSVRATIISVSVLFASVHVQYDLYGMFQIFITGLLFGYVRIRTGSIYPTILMHSLMNLIATLELLLKVHSP